MKAVKLLLHDWQRCTTHRPSATIDWGRVLSVSVTIRVHWPSPSLKTSGKDSFSEATVAVFILDVAWFFVEIALLLMHKQYRVLRAA